MVEEDFEAWEEYPEYRWLHNKLEIALKFKYECGPATVPIKIANYYIIRPIYNLYGMGIGAYIKFLDPNKHTEEMIAHGHVLPGYFWCEYFDGIHYSTDFKRVDDKWISFSCMKGFHRSKDNLVQFDNWIVCEPIELNLPDWIQKINVGKYLNIESKNDKIFEIHLRSGNDHIWNLPLGTKVIPVWKGEDYPQYEHLQFVPNFHPDSFKYEASGHLKNIRLGYFIDKTKKDDVSHKN